MHFGFNVDMGGEGYQRGNAALALRRAVKGDCAAVAVPDQRRLLNAKVLKQCLQVVNIGRKVGDVQAVARLRPPVAPAVVSNHTVACSYQRRNLPAPSGATPQPVVQQHHRKALPFGLDKQAVAVQGEKHLVDAEDAKIYAKTRRKQRHRERQEVNAKDAKGAKAAKGNAETQRERRKDAEKCKDAKKKFLCFL